MMCTARRTIDSRDCPTSPSPALCRDRRAAHALSRRGAGRAHAPSPRRADLELSLSRDDSFLSSRFRCIAPDYIGFGRSDKLTRVGSYSFAFHYERLERFADALGLSGLTLVMQDWEVPSVCATRPCTGTASPGWSSSTPGLMSGEAATLSPGLLKWREYAERTPDLPIGQIIKRSVVDRDGPV